MNEEVRFSGAIHRTMGKMVTYFMKIVKSNLRNIYLNTHHKKESRRRP